MQQAQPAAPPPTRIEIPRIQPFLKRFLHHRPVLIDHRKPSRRIPAPPLDNHMPLINPPQTQTPTAAPPPLRPLVQIIRLPLIPPIPQLLKHMPRHRKNMASVARSRPLQPRRKTSQTPTSMTRCGRSDVVKKDADPTGFARRQVDDGHVVRVAAPRALWEM